MQDVRQKQADSAKLINSGEFRSGGEKKGSGYFGELPMKSGGKLSEVSIGVLIDGKETEIPSVVPTLSRQELDWMVEGNSPAHKSNRDNPIARSIMMKAKKHAVQRMNSGKQVWWQEGEPVTKMPEYSREELLYGNK